MTCAALYANIQLTHQCVQQLPLVLILLNALCCELWARGSGTCPALEKHLKHTLDVGNFFICCDLASPTLRDVELVCDLVVLGVRLNNGFADLKAQVTECS